MSVGGCFAFCSLARALLEKKGGKGKEQESPKEFCKKYKCWL